MGTKISSEISKEDHKENINHFVSNNIPQSTYDWNHPFSSYEGIKSITSKNEIKNDASFSPDYSRPTTSSMSENIDDSLQKVPTKFIWRGEGNIVYVTGSFANWKQWFLMTKSNDHPQEFTITLDLLRGTYQYKFIVDKIWKFSTDLPQTRDEDGNINNIINNSEIYMSRREAKEIKVMFYI